MAPTKARKNAFTYYVEEYEAEQIANGRRITRKKALDECAAGWGELDPETRLRYCNMANPMLELSGKPKENTPANMEWLDPITGEYGEKWFRYVRAGDELHYLKNAITSEKKLKRFNFYLVHFNYFCRPSPKKYMPAELALLEFNLAEGIKNVYNTLINPGPLPLGFAHEAKRLSQDGHGIPLPPYTRGEKNMTKIIEAVKKFLKFGTGPTGKFPPLFTLVDNVLPAMHMLNDMVPYNEDQPVFTVYPVHRMFYWIKNKCSDISGKGAGFLDDSFAQKEIDRDCFRYIVEIACDFHKLSEARFPMCSQSIVKRLAFTVCDHCCHDLNIALVGGKHVHKRLGNSSPQQEPQAEEKPQKERKERKPENVDEGEEETALETTLAKKCNCGESPEFVSGHSTTEVPKGNLASLDQEELRTFYNAFMHNVMEGKVNFDAERKKKTGRMCMKSTRVRLFADSSFSLAKPKFARGYPEGPYEGKVFGEDDSDDDSTSTLTVHIKARKDNESREFYEKKIAEVVKAKVEGNEVRVVHDEADE